MIKKALLWVLLVVVAVFFVFFVFFDFLVVSFSYFFLESLLLPDHTEGSQTRSYRSLAPPEGHLWARLFLVWGSQAGLSLLRGGRQREKEEEEGDVLLRVQ